MMKASTLILFVMLKLINGEDIRSRCINDLFRCSSTGACIPNKSVCDGVPDCQGGEDEHACESKCVGRFMCPGSEECIPTSFLCDSSNDCPGGEDESSTTCAEGGKCDLSTHFRCRHQTNQCIAKIAVCNGKPDCKDGSDEAIEICANKTVECKMDEFKCTTNNMCILNTMRCDRFLDCPDSSDERGCNIASDDAAIHLNTNHNASTSSDCSSANEFRCLETKECISRDLLCNDVSDCVDGTDEQACDVPGLNTCAVSTDFYCGDETAKCIDRTFQCDGRIDCANGSDEKNCTRIHKECAPYEFRCTILGDCIENTLVCDGRDDCLDKSDEANCPSTSISAHCNATREFDCFGDGKKCIPLQLVCNDYNDCGGEGPGADEVPGGNQANCQRDFCAIKKGNCSHVCVNHYFARICACPVGYRLSNDNMTCIDVDECEVSPEVCSQICINSKGSYKCDCYPGYTKSFADTSRCMAIGEKFLYFSIGSSIREIRLLHHDVRPVVEKLVLATAIDFEYPVIGEPVYLLYTDVVTGTIRRLSLQGEAGKRKEEIVYDQKNSVAEGLAYDCIHHLLFWTDVGQHKLHVMNLTSQARHVLVSEGLDKPRGIVVDPEYRRVYWTDWGTHPKIESIGMDGQDRRVLTYNVSYPNGLAMDYVTRKLYWGDSRLHLLASLDLKTLKTTVILQHESLYPFGLEVFEDRLYWSDWLAESVFSIDKVTGKDLQTHVHARKPMGLRMLHDMKQPRTQTKNSCASHGCSHLCLPKAVAGDANEVHICACPMDGSWKLAPDRHTCIENRHILSQPSANVSDVIMIAKELRKPGDPLSAESDVGDNVYMGSVIGGVVCVMVSVIVASIYLACRIYKNYIQTAMHSVHFNNPVYGKMKTTCNSAMPCGQWESNTPPNGGERSRGTSEDTKETPQPVDSDVNGECDPLFYDEIEFNEGGHITHHRSLEVNA